MIYSRLNPPLNQYETLRRLMLLFPELTPQAADEKRKELLRSGELVPEENAWDNPEEAWTISSESWEHFENKVYHENEETRRRIMLKILRKLESLEKRLPRLMKKAVKEELREIKAKEELEKVRIGEEADDR